MTDLIMNTLFSEKTLRLTSQLVNLIAIVVGVAAAYFMTIQSLRIELAAKAESTVVSTLERKLAGFEVLLREGVVNKEQFYEFSSNVETRLIRIEQHLVARQAEARAGHDTE